MNTCTCLLSGLLLSSCSHTMKLVRPHPATLHLGSTDSFYVAVPLDGAFGTKTYPGSGRTTAELVRAELARRATRVEIGIAPEGIDEARAKAASAGLTYAVVPSILHWEDRATEWSGQRDKVSIKIVVVGAATGSVVDSATIDGSSRWLTFGGDHPEDLLAAPVGDLFSALFR